MPPYWVNDLEALASYVKSLGPGLVVLDGRAGAGKTTVGAAVAKLVPCCQVDADDFLRKDQGVFFGALRLADLRASIFASFAASPIIVFSSVCARRVVEALKLEALAVVWVQQISPHRIEQEIRDFADDCNADTPTPGKLRGEVEPYISKYNARMGADRVYFSARD